MADIKPLEIQYARPGRMEGAGDVPRRRAWWVELLDAVWSVPVWSIFAYIVIGVPTVWLFSLGGPVLVYPCLVLIIVLIPTLAIAAKSVRRRRAAAVLGYLQQAFRLNLPLERFLSAAARSERKPLSRRLHRLHVVLDSGATLANALTMAVPELPDRQVALIEHAEEIGKVPQVLDRLIAEQLDAARRQGQDRSLATWYPPLLLLLVGGAIVLMSFLVGPKYADILKDFHLKMPGITYWLFYSWLSPDLDLRSALTLAVPVALFCIFIAVWGLRLRDAIRISRTNWLFQDIRARILWYVPLVHGILYDRALGDLCTAMADSVETGRSLEHAMGWARRLRLHPVVLRRLERWLEYLHAGRPIDAAARLAGFPPLLCGMMNTAGGASLGDALRFLARFYSDRYIVRREIIRGTYLPLVTVLMGILVAAVALGLFLPLQRLILQLGRAI